MPDNNNDDHIGAIEKARTLGLQKTSSNLVRRALQDIERLTADVKAKDAEGQTPLHSAAFKGQKDMVALLIAKGADVNAKQKNGQMPLHEAASEGQKEVAELLITKGADINAKDNIGNTPLQYAELNNHKDVADLLKKHGAR